MDSSRKRSATTWLGLTLLALAVAGLMAQVHRQQAAATTETVLQPVLDTRPGTRPSPAQDAPHHRRPALSMPYFSFARLLRPGS